MTEPETFEEHNRFRIGMLARHPSADLGPVLAPLGIAPRHNRVAGEPRVGARGQPLKGTYPSSFWSWNELVVGERHFMTHVVRLVDRLEPHAALLREVVASGATVAITSALHGGDNIGSELSARDMGRLAALGIDLDIEVYPHIGNFA